MVSLNAIAYAFLSLLLALVLPFVLSIWFCKKYEVRYTTVLAGALTFFVFQIVIRIPLLQLLATIYPIANMLRSGPMALFGYSLFLASTAALFEEGGRAVFFKLLIRNRGDWKNATAFGLGHGGIEAILLVGIGYIFNLIIMVVLFTGAEEMIPEALKPMLWQSAAVIAATPDYHFLLGGLERLFVMIFHTAMSILVVHGVVSKKLRYVVYAFLLHTLINLPIAYFQTMPGGVLLAQAYVLLFAIGSFLWIVKTKQKGIPRMSGNTSL